MVSFGLAPALVMYQWSLSSLGKIGWLAAFIYTAGAALRLARFNTQVGIADKRYFQGLPSPSAAALVAGAVWVGDSYGVLGTDYRWLTFFLTVAAGALMVSNVRYYSFKDLDLKGKVPFVVVLGIVMLFVLVSLDPPQVLFGLFFLYAVSGPVLTMVQRQRRLRGRHDEGDDLSDPPA
jgi:CDP-diacylglycerol--serine O-phosphatidyltransferase